MEGGDRTDFSFKQMSTTIMAATENGSERLKGYSGLDRRYMPDR